MVARAMARDCATRLRLPTVSACCPTWALSFSNASTTPSVFTRVNDAPVAAAPAMIWPGVDAQILIRVGPDADGIRTRSHCPSVARMLLSSLSTTTAAPTRQSRPFRKVL